MAGPAPHTVARRALITLLALLALASPAAAAEPKATLPDIEDEVMCVECGTALNISNSAVADRQRAYIQRLIDEGRTKDEIKQALVAEFGAGVLAEPEDEGFGLAAYIVPPLLALLALAALLTTARRWRRASKLREPSTPELSGDDRRRLERDMAEYDL